MKKFEGKVVLVTGGNRNTGLEIVERFVRDGATVFLCGSSEASTAKGAAELRAAAHPKKDHWLRHYAGTLTDIRPPDSVSYFCGN